jgi:hypothetical protein
MHDRQHQRGTTLLLLCLAVLLFVLAFVVVVDVRG